MPNRKKFRLKLKAYRRWRNTWPGRLHSPVIKAAALFELYILDHGVFRFVVNRPTEIAPGVYRSAQPSPFGIKRLSQKGMKTIVSLRGKGSHAHYLLNKQACERYNLNFKVMRMYSKRAPSVEFIRDFKILVETSERPLLMHCKSGADRSGIASALYLLLTETGTIEDAKSHLTWRNLHFKQARAGILDRFLESYEAFNQQNPVAFMDWVENHYDPVALQSSFKAKGWATWLMDGVLRRE